MKVWLVAHPISQWVECDQIAKLARSCNLRVVDSAFAHLISVDMIEQNPPTLTLVNQPIEKVVIKKPKTTRKKNGS